VDGQGFIKIKGPCKIVKLDKSTLVTAIAHQCETGNGMPVGAELMCKKDPMLTIVNEVDERTIKINTIQNKITLLRERLSNPRQGVFSFGDGDESISEELQHLTDVLKTLQNDNRNMLQLTYGKKDEEINQEDDGK